MSEDQAEAATTPDGESTKRGRGRPQETIERDNVVFAALNAAAEPLTRDQLAEAAGVTSNEAYLSLYRLKRDERVERLKGRVGQSNKYWPVGKDLPAAPEPAAEAADASAEQPAG